MKKEIIIYYGGTFDPVHTGHISIAVQAKKYMEERFPGTPVKVMLVPAPNPPHKTDKKISPFESRFAMLSLALSGWEDLEASRWEEGRSGKSFTCDSLALLREKYPESRIFLLIGGDSLFQFHTWKDPHTILRDFSISVFPRPGAEPEEEQLPAFWSREEKKKLLSFVIPPAGKELFPVSSTFLRENFYALAPEVLEKNLPPKVEEFIRKHQLYT